MKTEDAILMKIASNGARAIGLGELCSEKADIDWAYLLSRSKDEGLSSLLFYNLGTEKKIGCVPIYEELRSIYYNCSISNMRMEAQLKEAVRAFDAENIPSIVLKGIFLAEAVYRNMALRPVSDIDILIKKECLLRANEILLKLGYDPPVHYQDFLSKNILTSINSLVYNRSDGGFYIHLHWHLINATWPVEDIVAAIDMERIWQNTEEFCIGDCEIKVLGPVHLLVYSLYHALQHHYDRMIMATDVMEILRAYEKRLNMREVKEEARRFRLDYVIDYSLKCAQWRLGEYGQQIVSYGACFNALCLKNKSLLKQFSALWSMFFPSFLMMAHSLGIPVAQLRTFHYFRRFKDNFKLVCKALTH